MTLWRTGRGEPHCIYYGDKLVGMARDVEDAAEIVRAMNERARERSEILNPETVEFPAPTMPPAPCEVETRSWDHFTPEQMDSYWIRCTLSGPHDEHKDENTGLTWTAAAP